MGIQLTRLLIATHNPGKLREFAGLLQGLPYDLITLNELAIDGEVEESGATIAENARIKATTYAGQSGVLTLADDSGLEVDALGGEPGVFSKRYAGVNKSDSERNAFLLARLKDVPLERRAARFRCVIAIAEPDGQVHCSYGVCEGAIAFDSRGSNGFGYDPVFIVGERGVRMAELPEEEKNSISHRARAAEGAREILLQLAKK